MQFKRVFMSKSCLGDLRAPALFAPLGYSTGVISSWWSLQVRCLQNDPAGRGTCLWTGCRADFARHRHRFDSDFSSVDNIITLKPGPSVDNQPGPLAASRKRPARPDDVDFTPKQKRQKIYDVRAASVAAGLAVLAVHAADAAEAAASAEDDDDAGYDDAIRNVADFASIIVSVVDDVDDDDEDDDDDSNNDTAAVCEKVLRAVKSATEVCARVADADLETLADNINAETNQEAKMVADFCFGASRNVIAIAVRRASLNVHAVADDNDDDDDDDDNDAIRYVHLPVQDAVAAVKEAVLSAVNEANIYVDATDVYSRAVKADPASPAATDATADAAQNAEAEYVDAVDTAERVLAVAKVVIAATATTTPAAADGDNDEH